MAIDDRPASGERPVRSGARAVVRRAVLPLLAAALAIIALMWLLGTRLVNGSFPAVTGLDTEVTQWVVARRTPLLDTISHVGTRMADTVVALVVAGVAVVALRWWLGRWRESVIVVVAIVGELLIFLAITALVHRDRPPVVRLDEAPPTSSFPSGHTGAAVALYACVAIVLLRTVPHRPLARALAVVGLAVPVLVAASRVYRGMHYLSDVLAGALASGIWLAVVLVVLLRPPPAPNGRPAATGASRRAEP